MIKNFSKILFAKINPESISLWTNYKLKEKQSFIFDYIVVTRIKENLRHFHLRTLFRKCQTDDLCSQPHLNFAESHSPFSDYLCILSTLFIENLDIKLDFIISFKVGIFIVWRLFKINLGRLNLKIFPVSYLI